MAAVGPADLAVQLTLPTGWIELPPPGRAANGLLRRNPYRVLARQLVASGAVLKPLAAATAAYLERVAAADTALLALATFVRAPSRDEHTFVTFAVFPGPPAGDATLEDLAARKGDPRESDHAVEKVQLPWGPAARATYTRARSDGGEPKPFVQYWIDPTGADRLVVAVGDVDVTDPRSVDAHISDIDALARTLTLRR